jgi:signal transduction histidine kinase
MTFRLSHLAVLLAVTTVLTAIGGAVATYRVADAEFRDVLEDDLEDQSELLAHLLGQDSLRLSEGTLETLLRETFESDQDETLWVNVYDLRTRKHVSNLRHELALASERSGSARLEAHGYHWHGYQHREGDLVVQLLRRDDRYRELQAEILEDITTPVVVGSAVNLLLLGALMALLLWPLTRLVRGLEARDADSLTPLVLKTPATEIAMLRDTLNRLIGRVSAVLQRERQFASDVAHELRTPLTTLKLELADPDADPSILKAEVDRIARLIAQLLTLARLEEGLWRERFGRVGLDDIGRRVSARFADRIADSGMTLRTDLHPATVAGDEALLEILLENLLTNAIKHCPPRCEIDLRVRMESGGPVLELSDTGPGIAEEQRERLTRRFARLDHKQEGLGLGLAICHKIVQAHGATLAFHARDDGRPGLRVVVTFPA